MTISEQGSFRNCRAQGWKHLRVSCLKLFINQILLRVVFRQNSSTSKLCSAASDESFAIFLFINELYRKNSRFLQTGRTVSFPQICAWNALDFQESHVKIKNQGVFKCFVVTSLKFLIANWEALIPLFLFV